MRLPRTHYATAPSGARIAYQVIGDGRRSILLATNWLSSIDLMWDEPRYDHSLRRLASVGRLILFDKRGTGSSDPLELRNNAFDVSLLEQASEDILAVLDATDTPVATIVGADTGGIPALLFAATHPKRVDALVLHDSCARVTADDDYPWGLDPTYIDLIIDAVRSDWGTGISLSVLAPSFMTDPSTVEWCARYERLSVPPATMIASWEDVAQIDVREVLSLVRAPTLVLFHDMSALVPVGQGRYLADNIPQSRRMELSGSDIWLWSDPRLLDEICAFLGEPPTHSGGEDRVLAAVLFTDLVSSTTQLAALGDRRWKDLIETHDGVLERALANHRGRLIDRAGDGMLATFDGPARAVRCAREICSELGKLGLGVRAGVHAGEIELRGEGIAGLAVHIAARVMASANAGEVVVSRTVRDLTFGSGLTFGDRGVHELKGVPGSWELFALDPAP